MDNLNPPVVRTIPSVVGLSDFIQLTDMITVTDPDPDAQVFRYQFRDNGAGAGSFLIGGEVQEANVWHEVSADVINSVRYRGSSFFARESFSVRVFDGQFWSNSAFGSITSGNVSPELSAVDGRVTAGKRVKLSDYVSYSDGDGDPATRYLVVDRRIGAGDQLILGSEILAQARWHSMTAAEFSQLEYQGADQGRYEEDLSVRVYDGFSWGEEVSFQMITSAPTVLEVEPQQVLVNQKRPASEFINAIDQDGDTPFSLNVVDYRLNANGGYWEYQGQRMQSAQFFTIPYANIDELFYVGGSTGPQSETVGFQVYDGFEFSSITNVNVDTVVPPEVSGRDAEIQAGHYLNMATGGVANFSGAMAPGEPILEVTDADGDDIDGYLVLERQLNPSGGHFVFNGTRLPPATWFNVAADELHLLEYRGGEWGPQLEGISVLAFSNGAVSEMASFNFTTLDNDEKPILNLVDATARVGTTFTLESLFTWSDPNGDAIESMRLYDTGDDPGSNYFTVNGVRQPARTWIQLDFDQVANVRYHLSDQGNEEQFRMTIFDGRNTSDLQTSTMTAVTTPSITANEFDISVDTIERVPANSIITQTDLGPSLTQYQVYDENNALRSGRVELDGEDLQQGVVHTLTADEFDRLVFKGAETDNGRQLDPILVRGENGITGWTEWTRVNVNTDPVGSDSLTSGTQWFDGDPEITTITYMFIDGSSGHRAPDYYRCEPLDNPDDECNEPAEDVALNQVQRESFRETLQYYADVANLRFVEVPYEQSGDAVMVVGAADLPAGVGAWAYLPSGPVNSGRQSKPGDIWFDTDSFDPQVNFDAGLGSSFRFTALHEVGHALGFKHPFEGAPVLSIFNDFDYNTVMSYTHDSVHNKFPAYPGVGPQTAALYDVVEIQQLYGANMNHNTGNDQYGNFFSGSYPNFVDNDTQNQTTLWDAGGIDTLNYSAHVADETIDLREGTFSSINGVQNSLRIAYDAVIENARGGSGNDNIRGNEIRNLLFGNDGDDVLRGGGGNDVMRGGAGSDTYIWSLGDGRDTVREEGNGGLDMIQVFDPSGQIDTLEDDFIFRRFGNDLRIDITLNQGEGQGTILINDFGDSESTTELFAFHNALGQQIGGVVDLTSIFNAADTTRQRFQVTNDLGANNAFIAVPVT